ncbi:serine/arginine repetitive matrix protein 2-like [Amphibalanus amphitrite]|uniref:serine/arginine repetitive matrix protein 2-like n=1 Tax=Amphibalanus amphitrite TaxID=1232801 RepID=UPI001C925684|nr:serine/arginine repetitive matrix protein 2-like [Amphibalanus amphitrite]
MSLFTYGDFCCEAPLAVSSPRGSTEDLRSMRWLLTAWPPEAAAAPPAASERHRLNDTILSASSEDGDTDGPERCRPTPPTAPPRAASPAQPPPALAALSAQLLSRPYSKLAPEPRPQQPRPQQPRPEQPRPEQLAPEPGPQQLAPEPGPQQLAPEPGPQQLAPEPGPQQLAPEPRPQQLASQHRPLPPRPQQLAPEPRPQPPRPQQLPPQPGRPVPRSVTGGQRRAPSPLPAPPRPDFVNSLITVSAETLRRVCGAGGRPWRALPPVAVPLTEQLTACRAVVPLRRLGPGELGRWLAPGRAGRRPTRSVSESLSTPARAPIVRARSWTEAELTSGAAACQSVWPPAAGRALDSARGGCVSGPPAARSGTAERADSRRLWPVVVSRRAAEEAARAVLGPSRRRRHHSRDRQSTGRHGRCEAPADGGAGDHRLLPSAPQNKAAAEREATSPLKKRPRKHDGSTCHHDYKLATVQVSAGPAVQREEAKTMEKPEPSDRRRTEVARDSVSASAKAAKEPDTTRTKIRDIKTKSAAATKDKDEHAKTKRSKSLDLKEEDDKAKGFAAMDRHLKHSEGKGAAAAEDKPAGAVKAKEAKRCTKPRTPISLFYPPDQLIPTPARLCAEPAACQPLSRSVSAPGTAGRAQLPAAAGTGPTSCSARDAQRRHSSPARPQQRAGHVTSRPAEPDSTRQAGPTERDPTREAGPTERDSTHQAGLTEPDPTRQARPLTPNRKETANQEATNSFLPQWTARDGAADPAVSERRPAPVLPAVRSGASPAPAVTGAGAAVPTSAAAAAAAAHPERPAASSSGGLPPGTSPAAPPAHPRDPDRALAPLPAPASAHAPNIAAAAAPPPSAVLAPLTGAAGPRTPDKYRSSSDDEAADSDGAPSRRLRGGAAPAAGSSRQLRAPAGTADDSGDSWSTPAHSGDDELSIFVAESDMEWEDPGPSACAQRTPGTSSGLAANRSPYTAPPRWPPSQPAAPNGDPGDQDTDQPLPPPAAAAAPCGDSVPPPMASAELEEGEIPPDCQSQDDSPPDEHAPAAESGSGTHQLPAPGVLRTRLRRLAADGEHPAALQLVRAACERSMHEPGPLLSPGCLASLYDVVVQACVLAGEPAAALQMIADLRSVGIRSSELFHNIIKAQAPAAWLSAPLSDLLSALVAGRVELPPATWRQLLQLCVHSHAAHPTWMTLGRMMDVGVMPPPALVERALRIAQADSDHLLGKSGWLLVRHVRLLTDVRPVAR